MLAGKEDSSTGHGEAITQGHKKGGRWDFKHWESCQHFKNWTFSESLSAPWLLSGPQEPKCFPCFTSIV